MESNGLCSGKTQEMRAWESGIKACLGPFNFRFSRWVQNERSFLPLTCMAGSHSWTAITSYVGCSADSSIFVRASLSVRFVPNPVIFPIILCQWRSIGFGLSSLSYRLHLAVHVFW